MKGTCRRILVLILVLIAAALTRADIIVDNLDQPTGGNFGPIGDASNATNFLIGQEFTLPSGQTPYLLNQITLLLIPTGGGGNITVSIWNVGADNNPTDEIAALPSQPVTTAGKVNFVPSTNISLPSGIYYVVAAPKTNADSGLVSWAYADNTNWIGSGALLGYADTIPGAWENYTGNPQQMSVEATPATAVAAVLGISRHGDLTTLSWPSALNGYVVESATNLATFAWQAITNAPTPVAGDSTLTNSWSNPSRFFRLRQRFVVNNLNQPGTGWDGPIGTDANSNDFLIGQKFTLPAGDYSLNKVTLSLNPIYGSGSVTVSIWNVGPDNNPTNQIGVVSSQTVANPGNVDFVPSAPITLTSGSYYVVASPTTPADNAKVGWYWTTLTAWTGFGTPGGFADTYPGSWENFSIDSGPFQMSVQATPTSP